MGWKIKFSAIVFVCVFPLVAHASTEQEYLDFFKKYELLVNTFDLSVTEMYSDTVEVTVLRVLPDGVETTTKIRGMKVKEMIKSQMDLARKAEMKNDYSGIQISLDGNKAKIKATRYSSFKCFEDKSYYMAIEKQSDGTLQIIEESFEDPIQTSCKDGNEKIVDIMLQSMVIQMNKNLPFMVDVETKMEKVSSKGKTLTYHYTLVNIMSVLIDSDMVKENMTPLLTNKMCSNSTMRALLDMGAIVEHIYNGKDKIQISAIQIDKSDCK